ncbi:MAG: TIGR03619 family F420-dependent LLM class oxidoreductase [Actinobacteria bacterium]|nr:TIGR03619 family F420-dependent LLM class oxidoreductase [Actinomycetota bacterium]
MRFSYAESMIDPSFYLPLARATEDAGFDSFIVPDSIAYPRESEALYPFTPDGSREFLEDKPFLDPFALSAAMGAVTERIRFTTFVVKLPVRHPVLVAKQAASVAVLTGNRFSLGVGVSPWPEDYAVTGTPWAGRGQRMDEAIAIIRGLCGGGFHEHRGEVFDVPSIKMAPIPSEPVPILVGGHSDAALARAARLDGWMHGGGDPGELPSLLKRLWEIRDGEGRAADPFEVHVNSFDAYSLDGVRRLADQGVTDVIVGFRWPYVRGEDTEPLQDKIDNLCRYADEVINPARADLGP